MGNARARKVPAQLVEDEEYQLRHERVAGIDVAKAKADVCTRLPPAREGGRRRSRLEEVPASVAAVAALAGRLLADGVELVCMESTSDYWRVWFCVLEAAGLKVALVSSSQARQLAGRPKTDRLDAQWIARLAEMGLLRPSFVPPPEIRQLRDLTRARLHVVQDRTREWQRLEKLLEGALVKVSSVVSSLAGNKTARAVIEALIAGERDPLRLAGLALGSLRGKRAELAAALEGAAFGAHHARLARMHLDRIDALDRDVAALDDEIAACLEAIPAAQGVAADGTRCPGPGADAAALPAAERLAEIPGVSLRLAVAIIAETGLDMSRFPTAGHLVSWAGLAPAARQSGTRSRRPGKGQGNAYLRGCCTQAANGTAGTDTFLGERLRRLSRRIGGARARCAVARSVLVIVWHLLNDPAARYADLGPGWHEQKTNRDKKIRGHLRQLRALGLEVTVTSPAALPASVECRKRGLGARLILLPVPDSCRFCERAARVKGRAAPAERRRRCP
jgi:transposase